MRYAHIVGWGMAVPERTLTNDDLARIVDTNDEWITSRTGIRERRIASPDESTSVLATRAARNALDVADIAPVEVDLIIVATATPDYLAFPSTACLVQDALGASHAGAFDLSAACTGFIYALSSASQAIRAGDVETVLVIGAEVMSRIVNWEDRATSILFGDGAGAFVLQASEQPGGLMSVMTRSDGSGADLLIVPAGGSRMPTSYETLRDNLHTIRMNGREVFRFATRVMASASREATERAGLEMEDIDLIIPHQANQRIINAAARSLKIPVEKFVVNLDRYGNTSAASIPIAACEAVADGRINPNDHVLFVGFGGGLTWGAAVVQWGVTIAAKPSNWYRIRRQVLYRAARVRSGLRRGVRALEGAIYGRLAANGLEPPHRKSKLGRKKKHPGNQPAPKREPEELEPVPEHEEKVSIEE